MQLPHEATQAAAAAAPTTVITIIIISSSNNNNSSSNSNKNNNNHDDDATTTTTTTTVRRRTSQTLRCGVHRVTRELLARGRALHTGADDLARADSRRHRRPLVKHEVLAAKQAAVRERLQVAMDAALQLVHL